MDFYHTNVEYLDWLMFPDTIVLLSLIALGLVLVMTLGSVCSKMQGRMEDE